MRAVLVRYAQPQPQRVNDLLDLVRRTEWALGQHAAVLHRDGQALWDASMATSSRAMADSPTSSGSSGWLRSSTGSETSLPGWAVDISGERPDAAVDAAIEEVGEHLEALGVPHEERVPPRQRG